MLAEASDALAASLDYDVTLAAVARLAVPRLADGCVVDVLDADGRPRAVEVATADSTREPLLRELVALNRASPGWERHPTAAPLTARGRTLGAITVLSADEHRRYSPTDLALVSELARRAAMAVDNVRLYQEAQRAAQEARRAVAARDEFLSVAAHELRTPLTGLSGNVQLLLRWREGDRHPDLARERRSLEAIRLQADKLAALGDRLLDAGRIAAGKLQVESELTDLAALVRALADAFDGRSERHPVTVRDHGPVHAMVDPLRLEQVLANLLDNAVKYSPHGGAIELAIAKLPSDAVEISVRDHGVGIPPEQRPHLFERFYRAHGNAHASGLGLGLWISREIAELHGGELWAEFPDDGGTRLVLRLPLAHGEAEAAGPS